VARDHRMAGGQVSSDSRHGTGEDRLVRRVCVRECDRRLEWPLARSCWFRIFGSRGPPFPDVHIGTMAGIPLYNKH
jgi:hypothetical protein